MVKTRLIPVLFIKNGLIVRSEDFSYHQIIGNVINEAHRYNEWNVDELIYIDISRGGEYDSRRDDHKIKSVTSIDEIVPAVARTCFMPLTFGGGIRTIEQVDFMVRNGADKITLNTGAIETPELISQCARKYGSQAVVLSIDYKVSETGPRVFSHFGQRDTGIDLYDWIAEVRKLGAGEVLLTNIDHDGKACGYDIPTIGEAVERTSIPVIACGGAGDPYDFVDLATETNVSGIAAGNWFHFVERSYPRAKELLKKNKIHVR
jgi:imidazole glycerol-phosphate synthase subunit HisF